ncbi:fructoselysine-6-phosphate deglycase [Breznakia blatticola]|uniref:Fructoselysine-6-phosphate deglycase n=1 Tax=Breznakia blatticola TaxID=1754012 RepID=A0A4R7ZIY2_9FIRM|nr:SIS domain-containing protein [Breznakia blatticola]TDW16391.1 fructoselysine-6-phosphate deglycase [Breznakia blatticola]
MEKEKVTLAKFDVDKYLKEGDAIYAQRGAVEKVADEIVEKGFKNIFFLGIGGTYAEFAPVKYFMDKYSDLDVYLVEAAEINVLRPKKLTKDSVVITASASGDTKEIVEAATWIKAEGIEVVSFTKHESPLGKVSTKIIQADVTTGMCEYSYLLFDLLALRILNKMGYFPKYELFADQMKGIFKNLVAIREQFDPKAEEIAKKYYNEPYNIWVGSGATWGETYLFSMCILEEMQWVRTKSVTSPEFFHGTLELVEPGVPVFLVKGEDECRQLDTRVERFCQRFTNKLVVFDTQEYALDGIDDEFRVIVSPMIATSVLTERLAAHYETYTKHNLNYRRYYRQFEY